MKKNILILACLSVILVSCQKDDLTTPLSSVVKEIPGKESNILNEPANRASYTKKILIEEFVGTTYGDVPEVCRIISSLGRNYANNTIIAAHHHNDILESPQTSLLVNSLTSSGLLAYPTTMFDRTQYNGNRFIGSFNYQSVINQQLNQSAKCGIALSSTLNNNVVTVDMRESFGSSLNSMCTITAYLIENDVMLNGPSNYQANNSNNNPKSAFFHTGNPMSEYKHQNVVRKCITNCMGTPIKQGSIKPGGMDQQTVSFQMPVEYNPNNCYIVAFISKNNGSVSDQVMNAQIAKLGTSVPW